MTDAARTSPPVEAPSGAHTVAVAQAHGIETLFTLSGAHVFPVYDGAVKADPPVRLLDVRHEQTAVFAAEALAKLTRTPGLAVLTAGPGVTNGISAITTAHFNGSPLVVLGGRAPQGRWGAGSLQELDHVPIVASITKWAGTVSDPAKAAAVVHDAATLAMTAHRGPVFLDFPFDAFGPSAGELPAFTAPPTAEPDPDDVQRIGQLIARARWPAFIVGSDVYWGGAWDALRAA